MAPKYSYLDLWFTLTLFNLFASGTSNLDFGIKFVEEPTDSLAVKRQPFILNCSAVNGNGDFVNITWLRRGKIINDERRYVLQNGSLLFEKVIHRKRKNESDEGPYLCRAQSKDKSLVSISKMVRLAIAELDRFTEEPSSVRAVEGESVRFQCKIKGAPTPNISWQKNKQPLPLDQGRYTVLASGVLQIHDVVQSDSGQYRCQATNIAKTRSSVEATLDVTGRPASYTLASKVVAGPMDAAVLKGKSVVMECLTQGQPSPQISWKFQPLAPDRPPEIVSIKEDNEYSLLGEGNLLINNLTEAHTGTYTCIIKTANGAASETADLSVLVPPYSLLPQPTQGILITSSAVTERLGCSFGGYPPPMYYWTLNGEYLHGNEYHKNQIKADQSGIYQCFGHNMIGEAHISYRVLVKLTAAVPPTPTNVRAREVTSNSIKVEWDIEDRMKILAFAVHYRKEAENALELQKVTQYMPLELESLEPYTNYSIYVQSYSTSNRSKKSKTVYILTEEAVPSSAPVITVEPFGSGKLKIQWKPLDRSRARGKINQYNIYYRHKDANQAFQTTIDASITVKDENIREFVLKNLEPNAEYQIRVKAGNRMGFPTNKHLTDDVWPWITAMTREPKDGPPDPPDIQVSPLNESALQVSWSLPSSQGANSYRITYQSVGESAVHQIQVEMVSTYIVGELEPNRAYRVGVAGENHHGLGEEAQITVSTLRTGVKSDEQPPPPPIHVSCKKPTDNTTITITWEKASFPGEITNFTVRYRPLQAVLIRPIPGLPDLETRPLDYRTANTPDLKAYLTGLEPFTKYEISVRAQTKSALGDYGTDIICRTTEGRPSAPRNPEAELLDEANVVKLKWSPPEKANGVIIKYVINYMYRYHPAEQEPERWHTKLENGTVTEAIVKELEKNAIYYFKLRAATSVGNGPSTKSIKVETRALIGPPMSVPEDEPGLSAKTLGIIIGTGIGGFFIFICVLVCLLRNRYCPPPHPIPTRTETCNGNSSLPNGYSGGRNQYMMANGQVFDSSTIPMIMENQHCDTKGSVDFPMTVMPRGQLQANYSQNGSVTTFLAADQEPENHVQENNRNSVTRGLVSGQPAPPRTNHTPHHDTSLDDIDHALNSDDFIEYVETDNVGSGPHRASTHPTIPGEPAEESSTGPGEEPGHPREEEGPDSGTSTETGARQGDALSTSTDSSADMYSGPGRGTSVHPHTDNGTAAASSTPAKHGSPHTSLTHLHRLSPIGQRPGSPGPVANHSPSQDDPVADPQPCSMHTNDG